MIELRRGDILEAQAEALVNTVNTAGVMGKGVALQFKRAFPDNYKAYVKACKRDEVEVGKVFVFDRSTFENPRYIINFPTKRNWRGRSRIEYIQTGLEDLVRQVHDLDIQSIALPPLGCGYGGLDWDEVRALIEEASNRLPEVEFLVYEPQEATEPKALAAKEPRPKLTPARASLLKLFAAYEAWGDHIGRLEAQKIAYFLQNAGMDLKLNFVKSQYGPHAEALNHVLKRLEGYYFKGYGDMSTSSRIRLMPEAAEMADSYLEDHPEVQEPIKRTEQVFAGFESRYGMELLATVHWVACYEGAEDFDSILKAIQSWNQHKKYGFAEEHIRTAWEHLLEEGWISAKTPVG